MAQRLSSPCTAAYVWKPLEPSSPHGSGSQLLSGAVASLGFYPALWGGCWRRQARGWVARRTRLLASACHRLRIPPGRRSLRACSPGRGRAARAAALGYRAAGPARVRSPRGWGGLVTWPIGNGDNWKSAQDFEFLSSKVLKTRSTTQPLPEHGHFPQVTRFSGQDGLTGTLFSEGPRVGGQLHAHVRGSAATWRPPTRPWCRRRLRRAGRAASLWGLNPGHRRGGAPQTCFSPCPNPAHRRVPWRARVVWPSLPYSLGTPRGRVPSEAAASPATMHSHPARAPECCTTI